VRNATFMETPMINKLRWRVAITFFSIILLLVVINVTRSQSIFSDLKRLTVDSSNHVSVYYNPSRSTLLTQVYKTEWGEYGMRVLRSRLVPSLPDSFLIEYNEGPSGDPGFVVYRIEKDSLVQICGINGLNLVVPGNGFLYVDGHTDNMFDCRRKYLILRDSVKEIPQPFYYVGLDSKTKQEIRLYVDPTGTQLVATMPKGSAVQVVLSKGDDYLIKTDFGLLGWITIESGSKETPIEGIYFAGD